MSEQSLLPAEPWYKSEVYIRGAIAGTAQVVSILLRMIGRYTEISITTDMVDAVAADITQIAAIVFTFLMLSKRSGSQVAPLTLTAGNADTRNAQNPPILGADPTKEKKP